MNGTMTPGQTEPYFGGCPDCGHHDGYINIGATHWFFCVEHKTRWIAGHNLFSTWQGETRGQQKARYEELDFGSFAYIADTPEEAARYDAHYGGEQAVNPTRVRERDLVRTCGRCDPPCARLEQCQLCRAEKPHDIVHWIGDMYKCEDCPTPDYPDPVFLV